MTVDSASSRTQFTTWPTHDPLGSPAGPPSQPAGARCSIAPRTPAWTRPPRSFVVGGLLALGACVTTYEDAPPMGKVEAAPAWATAVTIPFAAGGATSDRGVLGEFFQGVLLRMHEAAKENDVAGLEALLANYSRADVPTELRQHILSYQGIARGLRFREHARREAKLVTVPASPADSTPRALGVAALGAPLQFELVLPAPAEPVVLGGKDDADPVGLLVAVAVEDAFVEGGTRWSSINDFLWLPAALDLRGSTELRLPIAVDLPGANAVRRDVIVRVDLLPCHVQHAEGRSPVSRTTIAATTLTQWPVGYEAIVRAPLQELRAALQVFEPKSFARAFLAAQATSGAERETATELLIEQVRFGRADQAQVAMAALRSITSAGVTIGDRDGWLAWWQVRR